MKLLEYEAKRLLQQAGILTPRATLVTKTKLPKITAPVVLKSQVQTGGRGKLGGVVIVDSDTQLQATIDSLFALEIKGLLPTALLAEEKIAIKRELYISLSIDRETQSIRLLAHPQGGVSIEEQSSSRLLNLEVSASQIKEHSKELSELFEVPLLLIEPFLTHLFDGFLKNDATLLEINPLILTAENTLVAGDCKIELDDMAAFRHPDWHFEDTITSSNFVTLNPNGNVGSIANGAGLAMATVDAINASGLQAANFLDIGGGANTNSVLAAFSQLTSFPHIQAIVINIFAGITHCDEVAKAVIEAKKQMPDLPPLFIRLAGTNFEEAVSLLNAEGISTLSTLEECLSAAKRSIHG